MRRLPSVVVAVLVLGSVVVGVTGAGAAGSGGAKPSVDVTVDGSPVIDGTRRETAGEVEITVSATARANGTELDEIVVRVGGERRSSWSVNGTEATRSTSPTLDHGNNSVRVIVTDAAGNVNSTRFTVYKDGRAPHVFLTEPYETAPWHRIADGAVNRSRVTLSGTVIEGSTVEKVIVTHSFGSSKNVTTLRDVGEDFAVPLTLGYTAVDDRTNRVRISAVDEFGNSRTYEFEINVTDERAPNVTIRPFPNETSRSRVFFAGQIEDDVWIESATVTVEPLDRNGTETHAIVGKREYAYDPDRLSKSFNRSLYLLYPGTYEVTVNATDVTGRSTTETVTIERRPYDGNRAPTVTVDRDRTVVIDEDTLFLSGSAYQGVTERLVVETRDATTGETLDYEVVHSGEGRRRVDFDREVAIDGRTTVIVRATDPEGSEVATRFVVNGTSRETFVGGETDGDGGDGGDGGPSWPRVTVTHLQDGRTGTASSSVTVERAAAGTTVALPPSDGPAAVAATANASLAAMNLSVATATNVTGTVVVRERAAGALSAPPNASAAATVSVQHSVAADAVSGVAFSLGVDAAYLDANRFDPANLTAYRRSGGEWTAVETTLVERSGGTARYRIESPGLSVFSLARPRSTAGNDTAAANASDGGTGNATTPAAGNETAADQSTSDETGSGGGESTGEPKIFVSNVSVNRTRVAVNESVRINVTLANSGTAEGTYRATLHDVQGLNRTVVARKSATVPAGGERAIGFTTRFAEPGNHTVSVNGTQAGPVVVSGGGGLLSVLSVVPVRLIGMGLGVLVGLGVVLVLVRFVLRRVGGGGDEASG